MREIWVFAQTNKQTDRQTDGQTDNIGLHKHYACLNAKIILKNVFIPYLIQS